MARIRAAIMWATRMLNRDILNRPHIIRPYRLLKYDVYTLLR